MRLIRRYLACPSTKRRLLSRAVLVLVGVRIGLLILPFRAVTRLVARLARPLANAEPEPWLRDQIVWAVNRANRLVPGKRTCLPEALAGQIMLTRRGFPARLQIGVKKGEDGKLIAHAWVEDRGTVVIGGPASQIRDYVAFENLDRIAGRLNVPSH